MIHTKKSKFVGLEVKTGGKFPARRLLVPIIFTMIFLVSLLVVVTMSSENAEAGGLIISVSPDVQNLLADTLPQKATFTVQIKNDEPSQETVDIDYKFISPSPTPFGWSVQPSFENYTFSAGETKEFFPQVLANKSVAPDVQVTVKVTAKFQDGNPASIYMYTFIAISSQWYDVLISVKDNDNAKTVDTGDTVVYNLTVENKGNGQDTFTMTASGLPVGWGDPAFGSYPTIDSGDTATVKMTLSVPSNARGKMHQITAIATSQNDPSEESFTETFTTVNKYYSLSISTSPSEWHGGLPGNTVVYSLRVDNLGNADDEVIVSDTNLEGLTWLTSLSPGNQRQIPFGQSFTWNLTVKIDDDAKSWEMGKVRFNVSSIKSSAQNSVTTYTEVDKVYGVNVYIPKATNITDPDVRVYYNVQIRNTGNTNDTITLESSGEFLSSVIPQQLTNLPPDAVQNVTLEVDVPPDALAGFHYNYITATSEDPSGTTNSSQSVTIDVNPIYDVVILASGASGQDAESGGDPVLYFVKVWNKGTANDSISLNIEGEKPGWASLENYEVEVPAKSFVIVNMTVKIPSGEPINSWTIIVNGSSSEEPGEWAFYTFTIRVLQTYDVTVSTGKDKNSVPAGGSTEYYISVKNTGSGYDDFTVNTWLNNPNDPATTWSSVSPDAFGLAAGQNITIVVTVDVPDGAIPGMYYIQFNATSDNDTKVIYSVKDTLMTITEVTDRYEVVIAGMAERTLEAPEDVNVTYVLEVYNFGTGNDTFEISASGDQTGWVTLSTSLINNLPPDGQYNLSVTVNIMDANNASMLDGVHTLLITITSRDDPSSTKASDFVWLNTTLTATRDASLNPTQDVLNANPGDTVYFIINLTNTGSTTDTFELVDEGPYKGWGSILNPTVTLVPDQSVQITYRVDVKEEVTRDESPVEFYLWVKSLGANEEVVENLTLSVNINKTFGVKIFTTTLELTGDPGEEKVFEIEIKNEGNDVDDIILSHSGTELGRWEKNRVPLQPEESIFVNYTVEIDSDHDTSDIVIILNATSDGDETDQTFMTLQITVHVNPYYEVQLLSQQSQKPVKGGENVTFSLGIKNKGTDVDTYDLRAEGTYDWWATINPSDPTNTTVIVEAGQTKYIDILVSPPEGEDTKIYDIIINVTSQNDKTIIELFTFYANLEATYDVFIYPGNPHVKVPAGNTGTFTIFVENKGNADDQYNFYDTGVPSGWTISINPDTINVPAGETKSIQVSVTTSSGSASGGYNFTITGTSILDPTKESTTKLIVEVEQVYDVDISAAIAQKSVDIGSYVIYEVEIKNSGNGIDVFELSLSGTQANWASLYYNQTEQGDIIHISPPPGGSLSVDLNISIPSRSAWENAQSPTSIDITVEAESILDPKATPASTTKLFITNVNDIYEVSLSVTSSSRSGIPGDTVSFSITIYNDGTAQDDFNIEIEEFYTNIPGVSIGIWDDENPGPFSPSPPIVISDGGSQVVTMDITIPSPVDLEEVPTGDYYIRVKVTSKTKSTVWANWTFTVKVKQLYSAWITDSILSQGVDVGTSATYQLQVQNKGNKEDTITFEIVDDPNIPGDQASWATITLGGQEITSIFLNASESRYIILNVSIPSRGDPGYPSVDPTSVELTIKVKPSEPGEPGAQEDELKVTTNINPIYAFELTSMSPQDKKEADAGDQISFILHVQNSGTVTDSYDFRASNFDDTTFAIESISSISNLLPNSDDTTTVIITIDSDADLGIYLIEITVESNKDRSVKRTINLTVEITGPIYSFELTTTSPLDTKEGKPDETVSFSLVVTNIGTTKDKYKFRATKVDENIFTDISIIDINTDVDEGESKTTTAAIKITKEKDVALAGTYQIEITADSQSDTSVNRVILLNITITPVAGIDIEADPSSGSEEPGEFIDYPIKITNEGNDRDTFRLTLTGEAKEWGETLDATSKNPITEVELDASSVLEVLLRVTIPSTGETEALKPYVINVKATSTIEDISATTQVSTTVEEFLDLALEYSGSGSARKDYDPNKKTPKFSFRLTNNGNKPEEGIEVRVDPEDWTYIPGTIAEIVEPGESATFSLEFTIPDEETEGEYDLMVYLVSSVDKSVESDPVLITINITKPDLTVKNVVIPDEDELKRRVDDQVTIFATVSNEGHAKAEGITVKLYVGGVSKATETISSIEPGGSRDVSFRWKVVADNVDVEIKVVEIEEIDVGNNVIQPPIYLELKPDLKYEGEQLNFSNSKPDPGEKITIRALIKNTGGDAKGVVVKFTYGTKTIGTDNLDIDYDEVGEATFEDWTVPDKPGDSITIKATIDLEDAIGDGEDTTKSIKITEAGGVAGVFTGSGLIGMMIGLIIGALLFLIIGLAIGRRGAAARRGPEGMVGPSFGAFEKEMPIGAEKKAPKAPAPFERAEEEAPPEEEEKAKPREIARVRCPKCGKVTEVTSTQRPLQIPCECGTTLMLKK